MPVKKLTARFVETLKGNGAERVDYRDALAPGLELRVTASGRKSWSLLYRLEKGRGARRKRMALGDFPAVDLDAARTAATVHLGSIARGLDPAADQKRAAGRVTVEDMGNAYLDRHSRLNKRSWRTDEAILRNDVFPVIGKLSPREVERSHIQDIVDRVMARGAPIQANRVFEIARGVFKWGIPTYLDASPFYGMRKPAKEAARERVLTRSEIRIVWDRVERGSNTDRMTEPMQIAAKLLLLLAQRSSEVTAARRDEFDLDARSWVIPAGRSKNGRAHRLPLPDPVVVLLRRSFQLADEQFRAKSVRYPATRPSPFLFPSPFGRGARGWGTTSIGQTALNHALQRVLKDAGVQDVTPHDFRRSAATYMAEIGVPEIHISAVLNHTRVGVTAKHYSRYGYEAEMRVALDVWGNFVHETRRDVP